MSGKRNYPAERCAPGTPTIDRLLFWVREDENGCWIWQAAKKDSGYGVIQVDGKLKYAHRVAYEEFVADIPDGLTIDHLCRNRACVNPFGHLEPVPHRVNILRGDGPAARHAATTHCPKGHPYDAANTGVSMGRRKCRICARAATARCEVNPDARLVREWALAHGYPVGLKGVIARDVWAAYYAAQDVAA